MKQKKYQPQTTVLVHRLPRNTMSDFYGVRSKCAFAWWISNLTTLIPVIFLHFGVDWKFLESFLIQAMGFSGLSAEKKYSLKVRIVRIIEDPRVAQRLLDGGSFLKLPKTVFFHFWISTNFSENWHCEGCTRKKSCMSFSLFRGEEFSEQTNSSKGCFRFFRFVFGLCLH